MSSNNRIKKIDEFIKYLAKIELQNPNYYLNPDSVYRLMTRYGVSKSESQYSIRSNDFPKWIDEFKDSERMRVFVSEQWKYFCQFITKDTNEYRKLKENLNHIKLYIPVDSAHIQKSAKMIFDFISKNNITHASKIGSDIRCDDIVIRLANPEDAVKIMDFVKNNRYIQEGLIDANPFVPSVNGVGFVCDGCLSFNNSISILLCSYINGLKKDKDLSSASFDGFKKYMDLYSKYLFDTGIEDYNLCDRHPSFQNTGIFYNVKDIRGVYSLRGIFELFDMSLKDDFSLDKYFELYNNLLDPDEYYGKKKKETDTSEIDCEGIKLRVLIDVMKNKYGEDVAINQISKYIDSGREALISRDYGLRFSIGNDDFRNKIIDKVNSEGTDIRTFITDTSKKKKSKEEYLMDACYLTYLKYEDLYRSGENDKDGLSWASGALGSLIRKNQYNGFTRDTGCRENLLNNVTPDDALSILSKKLGISVEELSIMDRSQFRSACDSFISKVAGLETVTEKVYG